MKILESGKFSNPQTNMMMMSRIGHANGSFGIIVGEGLLFQRGTGRRSMEGEVLVQRRIDQDDLGLNAKNNGMSHCIVIAR